MIIVSIALCRTKILSKMKRKKTHSKRPYYNILLLGFLLFNAITLHAQINTYHVSTLGDDMNDGQSWGTPLRNLQTALDLAVPGDEIWVAQGTYYPDEGTGQTNNDRTSTFALKPNVKVLGGFEGVSGVLIPIDPKLYKTILSGDLDQNDGASAAGQNSYHVVSGSDNTILNGFIIRNGLADGTGPDENKGGGIFNTGISPTIENCVIENNAGDLGGGMYNGTASVVIRNVDFISNSSNFGGAVYNNNATANFVNCKFMENSSPQGGAIYNTGTNPNVFTNCIVAGNKATQEGGGFYNIDAPLTLVNSTITGNNATIEAGGIYFENTNLGVIQNTIVWNNMANNVTNLASATLTQTNSTLSFANALIDNFTPENQGGTVGILLNGSPDFIQNLSPSTAPNSGGDFRLNLNSMALDVGDNSLNTETDDFSGNARIQNTTIDLGAIEGAYARRFFVSSASGNDGNNGFSWNTPVKNLQTALSLAGQGDEIWVSKGTYYPDEGASQIDNDRTSTFTLKDQVAIYGGFSGTETSLNERNIALNETILSGDLDQNDTSGNLTGNNAYHVVTNGNTFSRLTILNGVTVSGGLANGTDASHKEGAGIYLESSNLTISNCTIIGNEAETNGGGIYVESATVIISSCKITGNTASQGGGIFNIFDAAPEIIDCLFSGNTATSGAGAYNKEALPAYKGCTFELNSATANGGAMVNDTASGDIKNTIFRGNSANDGGGVYNFNFSSPIITNGLFTGNKALNSGGAMHNSTDVAPSLVNCTLTGNAATSNGGGIFNDGVNITVANSILWNNEASGVTNTTNASISENNSSTTAFTNCLVANYTVQSGVIANTDPTFVVEIDPTTAPSTSGNFRLLLNSNAIDVGNNGSNAETEDLGGNIRVLNTTIDLGPYEGETTVTTWQSNSGSDWALGANWSHGVPSSGISAIIPVAATVQPEIDAGITYEVNDLTIENGTWLTVKKDAFFTVKGNMMGTGQIIINSGASVIVHGISSVMTTYKRNLGTTNDYYISSPVIGQDIDVFASSHPLAVGPTASDRTLRTFNSAINDWDFYQDGSTTSGDFQSGAGKSITLSTAGDITFNGDFPTSDVSIPITVDNGGHNMLGNPFPSSIAANALTPQSADLLTLNKNVLAEQTLWLFNQSLGVYEAVNQASAARFIPPGQGFFIASNGNNSFQFTESMQDHQTDSFQRSVTNTASIVMQMTNGTNTKTSTVAYRSDASTEFDGGLDSSTFSLFSSGSSFDFYTQLVANNFGRKIEIQSLPDSDYENMIIPIGFKGLNGDVITISADVTGIPSGYGVYIEDKNDNSFTSIENTGETFSITLNSDVDGVGRLFLHVTNTLSVGDHELTTKVNMFLTENNYLQVMGVELGKKASLKIYNIRGQEMFSTQFEGEVSNKIALPRLRTGLYIIHVYTDKGRTVKKILKH